MQTWYMWTPQIVSLESWPEWLTRNKKRKIIGGEFIRVFEEEARKLDGIDFLGQGTIYPDIVESGTKNSQDGEVSSQRRRSARGFAV